MIEKPLNVFVVERYYDNGVGDVLAAFTTLDDAQAFSDQVIRKLTYAEINITRCAPEAREEWRRFVEDRCWSTARWEHSSCGGGR